MKNMFRQIRFKSVSCSSIWHMFWTHFPWQSIKWQSSSDWQVRVISIDNFTDFRFKIISLSSKTSVLLLELFLYPKWLYLTSHNSSLGSIDRKRSRKSNRSFANWSFSFQDLSLKMRKLKHDQIWSDCYHKIGNWWHKIAPIDDFMKIFNWIEMTTCWFYAWKYLVRIFWFTKNIFILLNQKPIIY